MRWHPDKHHPSKQKSDVVSISVPQSSNGGNDEKGEDPTTSEGGSRRRGSLDDSSYFTRSSSSSFFSRSSSRRSHTPTPSLGRNSSRSSSNDPMARTISRRAASSPSPIEIPATSLSKLMSQSNSASTTPTSVTPTGLTPTSAGAGGLSRNTSRRSTTPIVFSQSTARKKPPAIEKKLECTLEELCFGGVKKIKITRDVISDVGIIVEEEETLKINVKPGWKKGTKITFEGKGDQNPGCLPADIIFLIEEKRHPVFKRVGDHDLELGVEIPLLKALVGCNISLPLLGGERMNLKVDDVVFPEYEKVVPGQGMSMSNEEGKRGDLRLKFLVGFPKELSEQQRLEIRGILENCC